MLEMEASMALKFIGRTLIGFAALLGATSFASANIVIHIDKSKQRMTVFVDDVRKHTWRVSTGTRDYDTPNGEYGAIHIKESHFSKEWDDAPMPHSIFFTERGHAIHGSFQTRRLGRAASHGCIRLAPRNAEKLFALVKEKGLRKTKIVVAGNLAKRK
jgi:lipoprotein-anchoring transpeptidase ErfK/SrfK